MFADADTYPGLEPFFKENLITGVLHLVRSGKEATVYCCEAHPDTGRELLAAKIYRSRDDRSFKNDSIYQEGRVILDKRMRKAFQKKSRMGREVQFSSWLGHEYETLRSLHAAGADVPRPYAHSGSAVLLEYIGDRLSPAPALREVSLAPEEAPPLFDRLLRDIETWLSRMTIHADLSPYNILYWEGRLITIDFPQAVDPRYNPNAFSLLERDLRNVCKHWSRYGVQADPSRLAYDLWRRHVPR